MGKNKFLMKVCFQCWFIIFLISIQSKTVLSLASGIIYNAYGQQNCLDLHNSIGIYQNWCQHSVAFVWSIQTLVLIFFPFTDVVLQKNFMNNFLKYIQKSDIQCISTVMLLYYGLCSFTLSPWVQLPIGKNRFMRDKAAPPSNLF